MGIKRLSQVFLAPLACHDEGSFGVAALALAGEGMGDEFGP